MRRIFRRNPERESGWQDRERLLQTADRWERRLLRAAAIVAVAMLAAQLALHIPVLHRLLTHVETWEGIPYRS